MPLSRLKGLWSRAPDHFEPDEDVDPQAQRKLRGHLDQIDYTAYAANRRVLGKTLVRAYAEKFERLGRAAALARTQWVAEALAATEGGHMPSREQIDKLAQLRSAYTELTEAYDAMRRMVERGYISYAPPA
jgi:hypothetical protein